MHAATQLELSLSEAKIVLEILTTTNVRVMLTMRLNAR